MGTSLDRVSKRSQPVRNKDYKLIVVMLAWSLAIACKSNLMVMVKPNESSVQEGGDTSSSTDESATGSMEETEDVADNSPAIGNLSPFETSPTLTNFPRPNHRIEQTAITISGIDITQYRYKVGPTAQTNCAVETGYSTAKSVTLPIVEDLRRFPHGELILCVLPGNAQNQFTPLNNATSQTWTNDLNSLNLTPKYGEFDVSWSFPTDRTWAGYLLVRNDQNGAPVTWNPVDGQSYTTASATGVAGHLIRYVGSQTNFADTSANKFASANKRYAFKVWAYDADFNYSTPVAATARTLHSVALIEPVASYSSSTAGNYYSAVLMGSGGYIYASSPNKLTILSTDTDASLTLLSEVTIGQTYRVLQENGSYLYGLRSEGSAVDIIDVGNKTMPSIAHTLNGWGAVIAPDMAVTATGLHVAYGSTVMSFSNINVTAQTQSSSSINLGININGIAVYGDYGYVCGESNMGSFHISNSVAPGSRILEDAGDECVDLAVKPGTIAHTIYVNKSTIKIEPVEVPIYDPIDIDNGGGHSSRSGAIYSGKMEWSGSYVFMAAPDQKVVREIDANGAETAQLDTFNDFSSQGNMITSAGGNAKGQAHLNLNILSDKKPLIQNGELPLSGRGFEHASDDRGYHYLINLNQGVEIIDGRHPSSPIKFNSLTVTGASGLHVKGNSLYVVAAISGLKIYDITNPQNPVLQGSIATPHPANTVAVVGSHAYVGMGIHGISIINVSSPVSPHIAAHFTLGSVEIRHLNPYQSTHLFVSNDANVAILSLANPVAPTIASTLTTGASFKTVFTFNRHYSSNYVYVGTEAGIKLWKIQDIDNPLDITAKDLTATFSDFGAITDLSVQNDVLYMVERDFGMRILHTRYGDNLSPQDSVYVKLLASLPQGGVNHGQMIVKDNWVYFAGENAQGEAKLRVFDIHGLTQSM